MTLTALHATPKGTVSEGEKPQTFTLPLLGNLRCNQNMQDKVVATTSVNKYFSTVRLNSDSRRERTH